MHTRSMADTTPSVSTEGVTLHPLSLLILSDNRADAAMILDELRRAGFDPQWIQATGEDGLVLALESPLDLILASDELPHLGNARVLELLRLHGLDVPVVVVSSSRNDEFATAAAKLGAQDYLCQHEYGRLGFVASRALEHKRLCEENNWLTEKLRLTEEVLHNLSEQSLVGIQIVQEGKYVYANTKLAEIFAYTPEEIYALESWTALVAEQDRSMVLDQVRRRLTGETPRAHYIFRGIRKDHRVIDVEIRSDRIEVNGRPAVLGMLIDVSDRKLIQEALRLRARALHAASHAKKKD